MVSTLNCFVVLIFCIEANLFLPFAVDSGLGLNTAGLSSSVSSTFKQDNEAQDGGPTSKFRVGFYVITPGGDEGYIDSINGKQCKVSVTDGSFAEAQLDELSLSHPVKNDTVFILSGDHAGSTGQVLQFAYLLISTSITIYLLIYL